jgi:hypothetical protein
MKLKCAECHCAPQECAKQSNLQCKNCTKNDCSCISFHPLPMHFSSVYGYLGHLKGLYAAALGIEIVCITAAEIGENTGLYLFGLNPLVMAIAYAMKYALAGFTTFVTILGRYGYGSPNKTMCSCSSVFEQESDKGFVLYVSVTIRNLAVGLGRLLSIYEQPNRRSIIRTTFIILSTEEGICILTAETVDLKYSILFSVPLAFLAGAFIVVVPEAYSNVKSSSQQTWQ